MYIEFQHNDTINRGYQGLALAIEECECLLRNSVKDTLLDEEQRETLLDAMRALEKETGFSPKGLMVDIQALENGVLKTPSWRIGEALAEVVLENNFQCRFHWNELRDARNPRGHKTGADIVGFIEVDGEVLFLFGEVKTSSQITCKPPSVMTDKGTGMENQLRKLYSDRNKRLVLISYLQNKAKLFGNDHLFRKDFDCALKNYYKKYQLIGVLIRDVKSDKEDIFKSYNRLKEQILEPTGLKLLALYIPIPKAEWLKILNKHSDKQ